MSVNSNNGANAGMASAVGEIVNINAETAVNDSKNALVQTSESLKASREELRQQFINSGEAKRLGNRIDVTNTNSILQFGAAEAEVMSKTADTIMRNEDFSILDDTGEVMAMLDGVMRKVSVDEIRNAGQKKKGFFARLRGETEITVEELHTKYTGVSKEIEVVYARLRGYEEQIKKYNRGLNQLYNAGVTCYKELSKYTIAGEMKLDEINAKIGYMQVNPTNDPEYGTRLQGVIWARDLLLQRLNDLRVVEIIALQSLPMIKSIEFGNINLARKIDSAFIVTIPLFRSAVAKVIEMKKQAVTDEITNQLIKKTNDRIRAKSQNMSESMDITTGLINSSMDELKKVEQSCSVIADGIRDTREIKDKLQKQQEEEKKRLQEITQKRAI